MAPILNLEFVYTLKEMASYTTEQLERLEKAIAQGVKKVTYNDKTVEYRDLSEMLRIREEMRKSLGLINTKNKRIIAKFDRDGDCE